MLTKIRLFYQIRKFYKIFGSVVGGNFINKLSDMTAENVHDVLFDINEVSDDYNDEMTAWLCKLQHQILDYCDKPQRGYAVAILILLSVTALVGGCVFGIESHKEVDVVQEVEHTRYTAYGRYYTEGTVITNDGNEWSYSADTVSDKAPYDAMPVWIGFDDNGTTDITDDIILGLVYDRETAIYDALETALNDEFELERDGNNIQIGGMK